MHDIASQYPQSSSTVINLEHGYFGAMALPVQAACEEAVRYANAHLSPFVRGAFTARHVDVLRTRLAELINAEAHEILLTRSASESMQVLIGQYHQLKPGDVVLWSNLDYPAMRNSMAWLAQRRGVTPLALQLNLPISQEELLEKYKAAIRDTPGLKLMLLSQVYPCNGQQVPVREIVAFAREHGVDVLVDSAHALGQLPVDVRQMDLDFAGFNLHKWIGAPPGLGFVFIRAVQLHKIEPHMGDKDYPVTDIRCRLHVGMPPLGAILAAPAALDFHADLGGTEAKQVHLAALREYWVGRVTGLPGLRLLSPRAAEHGTALAAFAIDGMSARSLQQALLDRFNIFTVERNIGYTDIVRATVALTTTTEELDQLVTALTILTGEARVL
nr:aminotransferase class V-fold PLP-dependent enzyme [uncultured Duganella sp.]